MAACTRRPYKLQVLSTNGERKLQGSADNPTGPAISASRGLFSDSEDEHPPLLARQQVQHLGKTRDFPGSPEQSSVIEGGEAGAQL